MNKDDDLAVFAVMSQSIAKLAKAYSHLDDNDMQNIVHDASLICLSIMTIDDSPTAELRSFNGGKMQ